MSNVNRVVTRTRRSAPGGSGVSLAIKKSLALAQLHRQMYPPFTVTRPASRISAGMRRPMTPAERVQNYRFPGGPAWAVTPPHHGAVVRLTGPQLRRAAKKARRDLAEWHFIQALGEDYARQIGWEW